MKPILKIYKNLKFEDPVLTLRIITLGIAAGVVLGTAASMYSKKYIGAPVRAIIKQKVFKEEDAKTLSDMGITPSAAYRRNLSDGKILRKYIRIANAEECVLPDNSPKIIKKLRKFFRGTESKTKAYDLSKAKLYIPEKEKYTAEARYEGGGSSLLLPLVAMILTVMVALSVLYFAPKLLDYLDETITRFKEL